MKKILFVHHVSLIGGASYCLLSIIKELDRSVYEPVVLLRSNGPLVDELDKIKVKVIYCPTLWCYPYNKSLFDIRNWLTIYRLYHSLSDFEILLEKCNPDIVYFNNTFLFPYLSVTQRIGKKSVIHIREHWPINEHVNQLHYIQKQILSKADGIVAINNYSAQMISANNPKITVIYDWIDLETRYEPIPLHGVFGEDTSNLKIYLYTGGLQSAKGAYEVLKTFSTKIKDINSRLLVLGFTKDYSEHADNGMIRRLLLHFGHYSYEYKVKSLAQKDKRIKCISSIYNIKDLLDQSYCMLSYFTIPHANLAMAEAMIEKLPCVAARTEESLEYTDNGNYAMLFDMNDIDSFERCVDDIDNKYSDIKIKLQYNESIIRRMFSKEDNCKRLFSMLSSL